MAKSPNEQAAFESYGRSTDSCSKRIDGYDKLVVYDVNPIFKFELMPQP